jgi:hypothetical protein
MAYPIFRGTLPSDMTFLGFNLSVDDARGGTPTSPEGFFFVFQEQPSDPRFGLEPTERANPTTTWSDIAWTNFAAAQNGLAPGPIFHLPDLGNNHPKAGTACTAFYEAPEQARSGLQRFQLPCPRSRMWL